MLRQAGNGGVGVARADSHDLELGTHRSSAQCSSSTEAEPAHSQPHEATSPVTDHSHALSTSAATEAAAEGNPPPLVAADACSEQSQAGAIAGGHSPTPAAPESAAPGTGTRGGGQPAAAGFMQAECRICFGADATDRLCQPCCCRGSCQYAHLPCLEAAWGAQKWCEERQALACEICGKAYAPALQPALQAALKRGQARRLREAQDRGIVLMRIAAPEPAAPHEARCCWDHPRMRICAVIALLFLVTLGLLYIVLFVDGDHEPSFWAVFLLRILAFLLPVYLVIQAVVAFRRYRAASRERTLRLQNQV